MLLSVCAEQIVYEMLACIKWACMWLRPAGADHVTSGATSDLRSATRLARHMVEDCGEHPSLSCPPSHLLTNPCLLRVLPLLLSFTWCGFWREMLAKLLYGNLGGSSHP